MTPGGESGRRVGRFTDIRHLEATDSTNADVAALARTGAPEGVVVVTRYQRAGRGRRGRIWTAPAGSALLASVLLRPVLVPSVAPLVGLAAGVAAVEACADVAGVFPSLKWPNDVVVETPSGTGTVAPAAGTQSGTAIGTGTGKLAGLLAESLVEGDRLAAVVVGMGCNLRRVPGPEARILERRGGSAVTSVQNGSSPLSPLSPPPPVPAPPGAAYLEDLAGRSVDRDDLLYAWLARLDRWCTTLEARGGEHAVAAAYRRHCTTLGELVRVELADGALQGRAVEVTEQGHLVVATHAGRRVVAAGDVVHLRQQP